MRNRERDRRAAGAHARRVRQCRCGRVIQGNAYYQHRRRCAVWLAYRASLLARDGGDGAPGM